MRAVIASFVLGGLIILLAMLAVGSIDAPEIGEFGGLQFIILGVFGDTVGKIFLICVVIAVTICYLAIHTATIRMTFAVTRDNNLPTDERIATVQPKTKTPIMPAVISSLLAILIPSRKHGHRSDLHGDHENRDHHDLHRLPAGDDPDASQAARGDGRRRWSHAFFTLGK